MVSQHVTYPDPEHMQRYYNQSHPDYSTSEQQPAMAVDHFDAAVPKMAFAGTTQARPIPIPARRQSGPRQIECVKGQPADTDRPIAPRKRRDPVHFKEVQWNSRGDTAHRDQLPPLRISSPARSSSAAGNKRSSKESGLLRRTSQSCRNKFQKAIANRSRRSSLEEMEGVEGPAYPEPTPLQYQQHKGLFDRLAPNKMLSNLKVSRYDTPAPAHGAAATPSSSTSSSSASSFSSHGMPIAPSHRPISAQYFDSQLPAFYRGVQHHEKRGGAAARRAAAAINGSRMTLEQHQSDFSYQEVREYNRRRLGSNSSAADSGADLCSSDVEMVAAEEKETRAIRLDPMTALPVELNAMIFTYLDANTLRACKGVSRSFRYLASDPLVWRGEYLARFNKETYVAPTPIQIGGAGIGRPDVRLQNWELMHKAREQINANWDAGRGRAIYMAGHTDSVYCVQFDEQKIITGSRDRTIRVWDLNTNRCVKVIGGPNVRPVPGPRTLRTVDYPSFYHAEASVNGTPYGHHIYHVPSDYHSASILCLQYDEEILVTGSSDNDLLVWDVRTYEPLRRLKHHQGGVLDVAFDSEHIVSCSKDCTIVVWDRKTLEPLRTLTGHNGPVNAVQLRGNLLVSASGDGVARLWDLSKMECVREFPAKERGLAAVEFSDDAKFVLAGGNDHVTYKFEVATGREVLQYSGHTQLVRSLFLDTQNKRVVSGSYDLDLRVYDYDSGKLITVFPEWTTSWMLAAKCDYRRIVSTSQDGRILLIDFGIDQDGYKIQGADLLAGCEPSAHEEL